MTFEEWCDRAGFTFLAPRMKSEFKECWDAAIEAEREACALVVWDWPKQIPFTNCHTNVRRLLVEAIRARRTP
jgi:hypothetical protein